jgi:transcriptional regulator NrdR family protein
MKCPHCSKHDSQVKKTERPIDEGNFAFGELKRRDRKCKVCNRKFFTYEVHEDVFRRMLVLTEGAPVRRVLRTRTRARGST